MTEIDEFAELLLEEAKRFLEKAKASSEDEARTAFSHAALVLGFCALEAHINAIGDEIAQRHDLSIHERALLLEQDVRLENGEFRSSGLRMVRLEDRIMFLHSKCGGEPLDRTTSWWVDLSSALDLRNKITHPKKAPSVSPDAVQRGLTAIVQCIDTIYLAVYKRHFPFVNLALDSKMGF